MPNQPTKGLCEFWISPPVSQPHTSSIVYDKTNNHFFTPGGIELVSPIYPSPAARTGPPSSTSSSRPSRAPTSWPRAPTAARTSTSRARPAPCARPSSPGSPRRRCTTRPSSTSSCPPRNEAARPTGARVSAPARACAACPSVRVWACSRGPCIRWMLISRGRSPRMAHVSNSSAPREQQPYAPSSRRPTCSPRRRPMTKRTGKRRILSGMLPLSGGGGGPRGTVEFRQAPGSRSAEDAKGWASVVLTLAACVTSTSSTAWMMMPPGHVSSSFLTGGSLEELWGVLGLGAEVLGWEDVGAAAQVIAKRAP